MSSFSVHIHSLANHDRAVSVQRFFKTGPGQYGEGDLFLGITVPVLRRVAKEYTDVSLTEVQKLLCSKWHEERLAALFVLVAKYQSGDNELQEKIVRLYLSSTRYINNWDLVDSSADKIIGHSLLRLSTKKHQLLTDLARSTSLWERRIAMIATLAFIRAGKFDETMRIAKILLSDSHDLMHKAVGWMLREVGKRDVLTLETFLQKNYHKIPRTALRYAVERLPETRRQAYLHGSFIQ